MRDKSPPTGLERLLWRAPILAYRLGLGPLFGERLIEITHIGRVSGQRRQVVLEVVSKDSDSGSFTVVSAWGKKADWYQNMVKTPEVHIRAGRLNSPARAEALTPDQSAAKLLDYVAQYAEKLRRIRCEQCEPTLAGPEHDTSPVFIDGFPTVEPDRRASADVRVQGT